MTQTLEAPMKTNYSTPCPAWCTTDHEARAAFDAEAGMRNHEGMVDRFPNPESQSHTTVELVTCDDLETEETFEPGIYVHAGRDGRVSLADAERLALSILRAVQVARDSR
jgi:hypothetical protein